MASTTIKSISLLLLLAIATTFELSVHVHDVPKSFVLSKRLLCYPINLKALKEMKFEKGKVLQVVRPTYGMPEAPIDRFKNL